MCKFNLAPYICGLPDIIYAVIVVINNDAKPADVNFDISMIKTIPAGASLSDALGRLGDVKITNGTVKLTLPARTAGIFTVKK